MWRSVSPCVEDRRRTAQAGCAVSLEQKHLNHIELEASTDLSFNGAKPFCIEVWAYTRPLLSSS